MEYTRVALVGCGQMGSRMLEAIRTEREMRLVRIVEPSDEKRRGLARVGVKLCHDVSELPQDVNVVVDCSPAGTGQKNKRVYEQLRIPALFSSGEEIGTANLWYSRATHEESHWYLRTPTCSATATVRVLSGISLISKPVSVHGYYYKINNSERMIELDYRSGKEVEMLTGIRTKINRIYLRGSAESGGPVYAAHLDVELEQQAAKTKTAKEIVNALAMAPDAVLVSSRVDTLGGARRTSDVLIVADSVEMRGSTVSIDTVSYSPEIELPEMLSALRALARSAAARGEGNESHARCSLSGCPRCNG